MIFKAGLTLLLSMLFSLPVFAADQNLPRGHYLYLGENPQQNEPCPFTVDEHGTVRWRKLPPSANMRNVGTQTSRANAGRLLPIQGIPAKNARIDRGQSQSNSSQFESYSYPTISWKPKPVGGYPEGVAKLLSSYSQYSMRLKLTLLKVDPRKPRRVNILDSDGLMLGRPISFYRFSQVPGTALFEAHGQGFMTEEDYRRAVDYSVE